MVQSKQHDTVDRMYCNQNKTFINLPSLRLKSEISGAVHLVQPGLTAGRQAGRQADEIQENFEIFKIHCTAKPSTFCFV